MRKYTYPIALGIFLGSLHGAIMWFIKSQMVFIYSQPVAFRLYYDPNMVSFWGAFIASVSCAIILLSYEPIYNAFESFALKVKENQTRLEAEDDED